MKNIIPFVQAIKALLFAGVCFLLTTAAFGQTTEPFYIMREYMKVEPGKYNDYLNVEKVWKAVHQRRKAEGKILDWALFERRFGGTDSPYDFMTVTLYKSGKEMEEGLTWDYITKGMNEADLAIANNTELTRKLVQTELYKWLAGAEGAVGPKFIKLTHVQAAPGKQAEYQKLEKMMQPVFEEACKQDKIARWSFGAFLYPNRPSTGSFYRVIGTKTLEDMLNTESNGYIEAAFKKVYPTKDFQATMKSFRDIITILDTDIWERVDGTE